MLPTIEIKHLTQAWLRIAGLETETEALSEQPFDHPEEAQKLRRENLLLKFILFKIQFDPFTKCCPQCGGNQHHDSTCEIAALIDPHHTTAYERDTGMSINHALEFDLLNFHRFNRGREGNQSYPTRFRAQYMTPTSRKTQTWLNGPEFSDLERAKLYCAIIRALGPAQHTQVLDDAGERAYFVDNEWAAIFDLVFWAKLDNPEAIANQFTKLFKRMSRR